MKNLPKAPMSTKFLCKLVQGQSDKLESWETGLNTYKKDVMVTTSMWSLTVLSYSLFNNKEKNQQSYKSRRSVFVKSV